MKTEPWPRLAIVVTIAASVAVPLIVLFVGNQIVAADKRADLGYKYVELSIRILQSKPDESDIALRQWAIAILDNTSPIPIAEEVKTGLERRSLPRFPVGDSSDLFGSSRGEIVKARAGDCLNPASHCSPASATEPSAKK